MKILTSDKTGNRPEVTSCNRLMDYLENSEYTHVIIGVLMRLISLLFWSCQFTDIKKFEHRVEKKRNC